MHPRYKYLEEALDRVVALQGFGRLGASTDSERQLGLIRIHESAVGVLEAFLRSLDGAGTRDCPPRLLVEITVVTYGLVQQT